ncbi:MAG TPA: hypothetical protein VIL44_07950 [Micromonospora sp.]
MTLGSDNLGSGSGTQDRFGGQYRAARRDPILGGDAMDPEIVRRNGSPDRDSVVNRPPTLPSLDSDLKEPVLPPGWFDSPSTSSLADHPVLRGLLMELPPKSNPPSPEWLDRWFEAARSILELLYSQDSRRMR